MSEGSQEKRDGQEKKSAGSETKSWPSSQGLLPGLLLVALGVLFLLNNLTGFYLDNWWALFILIPAVNNFSSGLQIFRQSGSFGRKVRSHFFSSFFFTLLSMAFFLDLDFGLIWPAFLILGGLGMLVRAF